MGRHNPDKLSLIWDKKQKDFVIKYPRKCDGMLIFHKICSDVLEWDMEKNRKYEDYCFKKFNLKDELEKRGYDITTLRFSIELAEPLKE